MSKYLEFDTPATKQAMELASDFRLKNQGLTDLDRVFWNLPDEALYEEAIFRNEAKTFKTRSSCLLTQEPHTARAASDKFVVEEQSTKDKIWWGVYNRPFSSGKV